MSIPYGLYDWLCFMLGGAGAPWTGWLAAFLAVASIAGAMCYLATLAADALEAALGDLNKPKFVARRASRWME